MNNILDFYEQRLKEKQDALQKVIEQLAPLQMEKTDFEESIKSLSQLIAAEKKKSASIDKTDIDDTPPKISTGKLTGKTGLEAYTELASIDFREKAFKEKDIRELANKEGLLINGQLISGSYSRGLIARMLDKGLLEKTEQGLYRFIEQKRAESSPVLRRQLTF